LDGVSFELPPKDKSYKSVASSRPGSAIKFSDARHLCRAVMDELDRQFSYVLNS
jgi:hypothetical protein